MFYSRKNIFDDDFLTRIRASSNTKQNPRKGFSEKEKSWQEHEGGVITWQERIYVTRNRQLQEDIIREHHDSVAAGHPGRYKTQELITRNYWWPYIQSDIRKYSMDARPARGPRHIARNPGIPSMRMKSLLDHGNISP